jgi:hypothetical protein
MRRLTALALVTLALLSFPAGASAWSSCNWVFELFGLGEYIACRFTHGDAGKLQCDLELEGRAPSYVPRVQTIVEVDVDGGPAKRLPAGTAAPLPIVGRPALAKGTGWRSGTGLQCDATPNALTCGSLKTRHGFAISTRGQITTF